MSVPAAPTLLSRLERRASEEPEGEAFRFEERPLSYGQLLADADRFASALLDSGLERGGRVVIALGNGPDFFSAFYGTLRAAGIAVPVYPELAETRLRKIAERCGASLIVTETSQASNERPRVLGVSAALRAHPRPIELPVPVPAPADIAYIQYTSGSTGEPKGVPITHAALLANIEQMIRGMEITEREVFVSWLPVCHDMGLVLMTMVPFYLGARLTLLPASLRQVRPWLAAIDHRRATFTAAPDFAYRLCLRYVTDPGKYDLSSLRVALNAAEPVRRRTVQRFEETFGLDNVMRPGYGLAEATVGVSMWPPGPAVKIDERGLLSVGAGFPDVDFEILAADGLAGPNEVGEILVKSPANTRGYWSGPATDSALFYRREYLRTGDLGYLDDEGDLFVAGRQKNVIIQAGRNLAPGEIEEVLDSLPFTRRSAAIGVDRGGDAGEQVFAFVEVRGGKPWKPEQHRRMAAQATRAIRAQLGLGPGRLYLTRARTIPTTHNGKTRYGELKRLYLAGVLRQEGKLLFPDY